MTFCHASKLIFFLLRPLLGGIEISYAGEGVIAVKVSIKQYKKMLAFFYKNIFTSYSWKMWYDSMKDQDV